MISIAVCDDSISICTELENIVLEFQKQTNKKIRVEVFYSGKELIYYIKNEHCFDLIFLDIELGKISGIEVGKIIRNELEDYITKIVYISSKNSYDRQLFDIQPLHFLPKPLDKKRVVNDIWLALKLLNKENEIFVVRTKNEIHKIPIKKIIYFESKGKKVKIVSVEYDFEYYDNIKNILSKMKYYRFASPHRSYIINYDHILRIENNVITMSNQDSIPLSRNRAKELKSQCIDFERNHIYGRL